MLGDTDDGLHHQMNVTPFIDVMLVLLAIFMVASSVMIADMQVVLPSAQSAQERGFVQHDMLNVSIVKSGGVYVQQKLVEERELIDLVANFKKDNEKTSVIISADEGVSYGRVVGVMDILKKNGIGRVMLSTKLA